MQIEITDGDEGWPLVVPLDREIYPPDVMARMIWREVQWAHANQRVFAYLDGRVVSHVGLYRRDGTIDGKKVRICGIGGVMTSASVRRQGFGSAAMKKAAELMEDDDIGFGLLFCEPHNIVFYETLGWRRFTGDVYCEQKSTRARFSLMGAMILPLRDAPRSGIVDLCGLPW